MPGTEQPLGPTWHYLYVENFGPIKKAEIEFGKYLVLIGESGTGKSTIAQIIYYLLSEHFSKGTNEIYDFFNNNSKEGSRIIYASSLALFTYYGNNSPKEIDLTASLVSYTPSNEKSPWKESLIESDLVRIHKLNASKEEVSNLKLPINIETRLINTINRNIDKAERSITLLREKDVIEGHQKFIDQDVDSKSNEDKYDYSPLIMGSVVYLPSERIFAFSLQRAAIELINRRIFIRDFVIELSIYIKRFFERYSTISLNLFNTSLTIKNNEIYESKPDDKLDFIPIPITFSSSGVQHYLPIFIFLKLSGDELTPSWENQDRMHAVNKMLIIEEPEQSLFPKHQIQIVNDIISARNQHDQWATVITTHSPYVLQAFNLAVHAGAHEVTLEGQPTIAKGDLSCYLMEDGTARSLMNEEGDLIEYEAIDQASDLVLDRFNKILNAYK